MDSKHRLDAPNNDNLRTIEQLDDRSGLSTIYPGTHTEWEETAILSRDEREAKRTKEHIAISTSIRKQCVVVGITAPTPVILLGFVIVGASVYLEGANAKQLPLAFAVIAIWMVLAYISIRKTYSIFYSHALSATPFIATLLVLLGLSTQAIYLATRPLHSESILITAGIVAGFVYIASIILSGLLLFIWTSPRLTAQARMGSIAFLAALIVVAIFVMTLTF